MRSQKIDNTNDFNKMTTLDKSMPDTMLDTNLAVEERTIISSRSVNVKAS